MAINIYIRDSFEEVDYLCEDKWDLASQIHELQLWLEKKGKYLPPNKYVCDIGFEVIKDSNGGGGDLSSKSMIVLGEIGMDIYFSEYSNTIE